MSTGFPRRSGLVDPAKFQAFRRALASTDPAEVEDSVPLRVLVQLLVIVGIIAIDVAAADVVDSPGVSFWAVPVSIIGGCWSWYRRYKANIPVKFCIAIAMLIALAVFFMRLVGDSNDTRLVLAELLIQLQVFHSFDLPRRKDLSYSVVIGIILMGVAATLSQTLIFAPILLAFVAVAIPVLMLDYRSRLGLSAPSFQGVRSDLSLRRLGTFLAIILALGLAIFAVMPRFPGYQLRNFPVSAPINFQGEFNAETITNPGYVRDGVGNGTGGTGEESGTGAGQMDDESYYGFNSRINQNLRGTLTPRVVMRVRSQAEGFLRVLAFDRYTGQGWEISRNEPEQMRKLDRPNWTFRFNLPLEPALGRRKEVIQSYTVVAELPNVIPVMYEARQLYFPTREVAIDLDGGLRSPVPLSEGLTYTVVSEVPYRNRTQLQRNSRRYPETVTKNYLGVPGPLQQRIQKTTQDILNAAPTPVTTPYEQALYLAQYLKQNYTLQPDLPFFGGAEDLAEAFLYRYQGGYPDHFSTVLTLMLRSIGIPSRLVVGFLPGQFNPFTGYYIVKNTDAFALTEVYISGYGWFAFNPIPGMEVVPPTVNDYQTFSVLRQFWNWIAGWLPSPIVGLLGGVFEWIAGTVAWVFAQLTALFSRGWVGILLGAGLLTGLAFLGWIVWSGWHSWRYHRWLDKLPPMESLYQRMLKWLEVQGIEKSSVQTPLEFARQVRYQQAPIPVDVVDEISSAYLHWRYGGQAADMPYLTRRLHQARQQTRRLKRIRK